MNSENSLKSFLDDANRTGFCVSITNVNGKTSVVIKSRRNPGEPLQTQSINNASDAQVWAVCQALDNI